MYDLNMLTRSQRGAYKKARRACLADQVERGIGYAGIIAYSVLVFVAATKLIVGN